MRLEKGKQLVVYFGYLSEIESPSAGLQETSEPKSQTDLFADIREEEVKAERNKLLEKLNKSRDVYDVSDLYVKLPTDMLYNPIFFKIHLPVSLQKPRLVMDESLNACSEDFDCVYCGGLLFISAICDLGKIPYGAYDVRDCVINVLGRIAEIKITPPTLYASPIIFALKAERTQSNKNQNLFEISEGEDSKMILRKLHHMTGYELDTFYEICAYSYEVSEKVEKIENDTAKLLDIMSEVSKRNWKNKFITDTAERRKDIIKILAEVAECQSTDNMRIREMRDFKMFTPRTPFFFHIRD